MDSQAFVEVVRDVVLDAAVEGTVHQLESPPGRRPSDELRSASAWYRGLPAEDQAMVRSVLAMSAHAGVFGFLAVLDGARAIEDGPVKGELVLELRRDGAVDVLTNGYLHEYL